jgi:hypothetical protein
MILMRVLQPADGLGNRNGSLIKGSLDGYFL